MKLNIRIAFEELRKTRQHEVTRQRAVDVDAQHSLWRGAGKCSFGLLDVRDDRQTTPIVGFTVERRADLPCGALKQADAEPRFELLDAFGHRRAWQAKILRLRANGGLV